MANTKIRGVTIEIGGDTSGLQKELKGVNSDIKSTQSQLKDVQKLLKLDPTNIKLIKQEHKLLGEEIKQSTEKLKDLKKIQDKMDENGVDKNSEQYMALQREIIATKQQIKELRDESSKTNAVLSEVSQFTQKVANATEKLSQKTRGLSGAAGGVLGAIGVGSYNLVQTADDLNTMAKQTGFSTEMLQEFGYAADLMDVSVDDIVGAARKLKKNLTSSSDDVETAFRRLGVNPKYISGEYKDMDTIFMETVSALGKVTNETDRDILAMNLFGKSADELAGLVDDGGESFKGLAEQAHETGSVLDQETLDSLNTVNDTIDTLKANLSGDWAQTLAKVVEELAPKIEEISNSIQNITQKVSEMDTEKIMTIIKILGGLAILSPVLSAISTIMSGLSWIAGTAIPWIIKGVGTLSAAVGASTLGIIAGVVALVAAIAIWGDEIQAKLQQFDDWLQGVFEKDWTEVFGPELGGSLNRFFQNVQNVWGGIKKVFDGIIDFIRGVFTGDWERAWLGVREIFGGIFQTLGGLLLSPINGVISIINGAIRGINKLISRVNGGLGSVFGFNIGTIGEIPFVALAKGGVLSQGSAIVGEKGPELLTMQGNKAMVQPLNAGSQESGSAGHAMASSNQPIFITVKSVLDGRVIGQSTTRYQGEKARAYG